MTVEIGHRLGSAGKFLLALAGTVALAAPLVVGLVNAPPKPASQSFEPSSVTLRISRKTIAPGFAEGASWTNSPGRLTVDNASLRTFIESAYRLPDYEIAGGPSWIDVHQYQVTAQAPPGHPPLRHWQSSIFQSLLRDKFQFESHRETRELPIYELTVTKTGAKLERSEEKTCPTFPITPYPEQLPLRGCRALASGPNIHLNHTLDATGMSIGGPSASNLANFLSGQVGGPVIDKTGLRGLFDFRLEWSVNATARSLGLPAGLVEADNPSLFSALEEQLGLQLESAKGPVEVLVVDRAEKPVRLFSK